jgi:hypothetical protein
MYMDQEVPYHQRGRTDQKHRSHEEGHQHPRRDMGLYHLQLPSVWASSTSSCTADVPVVERRARSIRYLADAREWTAPQCLIACIIRRTFVMGPGAPMYLRHDAVVTYVS